MGSWTRRQSRVPGIRLSQLVQRPACVVLGGRGSYDYKNTFGLRRLPDPSLMLGTPNGLIGLGRPICGSEWHGIPEMAIGRLPVLTDDGLNGVVDKIEAYEAGGDWNPTCNAGDNPDDGGNFPVDSDTLAALINTTLPRGSLYLSEMNISDARSNCCSA